MDKQAFRSIKTRPHNNPVLLQSYDKNCIRPDTIYLATDETICITPDSIYYIQGCKNCIRGDSNYPASTKQIENPVTRMSKIVSGVIQFLSPGMIKIGSGSDTIFIIRSCKNCIRGDTIYLTPAKQIENPVTRMTKTESPLIQFVSSGLREIESGADTIYPTLTKQIGNLVTQTTKIESGVIQFVPTGMKQIMAG